MDITGIIKLIKEEQQVSDKFKKRDFILTDNSSNYPQHISFQLVQDKVDLINKYRVGDEIKVHFNLRGKEWVSPQNETKYFNTFDVWRIEGVNVSANNTSSNSGSSNDDFLTKKDDESDLPF